MEKVTSGKREELVQTALRPLIRTGMGYWLVVGAFVLVLAWGIFAYVTQYHNGLVVTGMRDRISWGLYIVLFVFFIGISHAGTLISAILRVVKAQWRTPVTRMAEFITVVALSVGALMPLIDMGHPDRAFNLVRFGRWQSPLVWDILAITTYLTGSIIYLYLPLIPDLALSRDRLTENDAPAWKRQLYRIAAVGWHDTPQQQKYLKIAMGFMMVLIIPVAVSVHTVVSWIFAMTLRDAWNSTVFGPYFVAGAIYSGVAALILLMAILRKAFRLGAYITDKHFINLGYILGGFTLLMLYFNLQEYIVTGYKMAGESSFHFLQMFAGQFAPVFWFYVIGGMVLPGLIILLPVTRTFTGILVASGLALTGMWVERWLIVVAGLSVPLMPYEPSVYAPTWVEWSIMAGAFAMFGLVIAFFVKLVPVVSVWEVAEQYEESEEKQAEHAPSPQLPRVPVPALNASRLAANLPENPPSSYVPPVRGGGYEHA
ncbi:MAG: polysulfide reductase NrfD [Chloroflexi bacterium]|nr:polysulfide reductase NrfD [Chloroflexota bacterium]